MPCEVSEVSEYINYNVNKNVRVFIHKRVKELKNEKFMEPTKMVYEYSINNTFRI